MKFGTLIFFGLEQTHRSISELGSARAPFAN